MLLAHNLRTSDLLFLDIQILPDGTVWLPALVERIVEVAISDTASIVVDKKLIDGPNANERVKWWIPLLVVAQVRTKNLLSTNNFLSNVFNLV